MKYYVQFPIQYDCNLRCPYCFNRECHDLGKNPKYQFTPDHFKRFREKYLANDQIIMHCWGGEGFVFPNILIVRHLFNTFSDLSFDLLSNGTVPSENYISFTPYKERILRLGLTYHRKVIKGNPEFVNRYRSNVLLLKDQGFNVYVKELLFQDELDDILENREFWKKYDVPLKIQEYRQSGCSLDEAGKLKPENAGLIDSEYYPYDPLTNTCTCKAGYKNIIIKLHGSMIACWHDDTPIGDIRTCMFNRNYHVERQNYSENGVIMQKEKTVITSGCEF